jgi:hypothetical protein
LQSEFERNHTNLQVAYELFTELNRLGKYNTVIRLYDKYEMTFVGQREMYADRLHAQYEFAKDNIGSLGISVTE